MAQATADSPRTSVRHPLAPLTPDEAGLAAKYGVKVKVIPGDSMNFKITRPDDLAMAEAIYAKWGQS